MKIAADAFAFLIPLLVIAGLLWAFGFALLGSACLGMALLVGLFFRDPNRKIPSEKDLVLAPADGKVLDLSKAPDGTTKVSIFLSIWDVHINRSPIRGTIQEVRYHPGKFRMAFDRRASVGERAKRTDNHQWLLDSPFQPDCRDSGPSHRLLEEAG